MSTDFVLEHDAGTYAHIVRIVFVIDLPRSVGRTGSLFRL